MDERLIKNSLRAEMTKRRKTLASDEIQLLSAKVCSNLGALIRAKQPGTVMLYSATGAEVNLNGLVDRLLEAKVRVAMPKCTGEGKMQAFEIM
ncbi:MAG TPA: 5-formyltetrahydrofolate cyclo-ligase, partial [Clostridia bacterium]|nr:5-formyltetrahydrofolate cyclo-ligase [Clostridia bacterium]